MTPLHVLYEADETAWLDAMARLAAERRFEEFDCENLSEFLESMVKRDRTEVVGRMVVLLMDLLKWDHQPERRSGSWRSAIRTLGWELAEDCQSGTLRNHAINSLTKAYAKAKATAADETGLPVETFPTECPWTVDELIDQDKDLLA